MIQDAPAGVIDESKQPPGPRTDYSRLIDAMPIRSKVACA
jgi:hypothetical protein